MFFLESPHLMVFHRLVYLIFLLHFFCYLVVELLLLIIQLVKVNLHLSNRYLFLDKLFILFREDVPFALLDCLRLILLNKFSVLAVENLSLLAFL